MGCLFLFLFFLLGRFFFLTLGSLRCQSTSCHGTRCCFLAQPCLNHIEKTQLRTDIPRRQTKRTEDTQDNNDALTLLRLQQHVLRLTTAQAALENIQTLCMRLLCTTLPVHKIVEHLTQPSAASTACESGLKPRLTLLKKQSNNDNCRSHNSCGKNLPELLPPQKECCLGATNTPISKPAMMCTLPTCHNQVAELPNVNRLHLL